MSREYPTKSLDAMTVLSEAATALRHEEEACINQVLLRKMPQVSVWPHGLGVALKSCSPPF